MNENYKVSVIIPVYNSEKFLKQSLESVLNQTYPNIEIIVINDGSTDHSLEILNQFNDEIIIINQKNMGLAKALDVGIKKMSGKWLKWFSPDDVMYADALETLICIANELPENSIVYSNWDIIDEHNKFLRTFHEPNYNELDKIDFNVRLLEGQIINVNTALIPYSLIQKGCKFQNLDDMVLIDYDFFLQAGLYFDIKFHLIEKPLIKSRIHSKQLSHQKITHSLKQLKILKNETFRNLTPYDSILYANKLKEYKKSQNTMKKTMMLGLNISSKILPDWFTDKILIYYLHKIRSSR